ncbi:hypothetical protein AALF16_25180 [Bacillus cereus]|uniref:CDI toxin immunity protein n=1 Tax=Bacillus cereus TaxID=1396 RepID=UPI00356DF167
MGTLLEECIEALGQNIRILSKEEREMVLTNFETTFPITQRGRIEWSKIAQCIEINTIDEITSYLNSCYNEYNKKVYLIWDEGTLPIIKTDLDKVLEVIDDVTAVSFDTWIYAPHVGYAVLVQEI